MMRKKKWKSSRYWMQTSKNFGLSLKLDFFVVFALVAYHDHDQLIYIEGTHSMMIVAMIEVVEALANFAAVN